MVTAMLVLSGLLQQRPAHRTAFEPRFEVRSGLHRGARIKLSGRCYCIGSATETDIVLRDSGVASRHALLQLEGQRVKIEARDGNVGVGPMVLTKGRACYLRLPAKLVLGGVNLRIVPAPRPRAAGIIARVFSPVLASIAGRPTALLAVISLQVLMLSFVAGTLPTSTKSLSSLLLVRRGGSDCRDVARSGASPPSPVPRIQDMLRIVRKQPDVADISGLAVAADVSGISDTGAPNRADATAGTNIQQWFEGIYRNPTRAPRLRHAAVWQW
jgi:hypothetical protein